MAVGQPVDEFELMRRRVRQESKAAGQQRQEELKRQFARTGMLQSGAAIKQAGIESQQQEQQTQRALEGVDIAQAQTLRAEREAEKQREFARSERLGAQEFTAGQAELQRKFATGERIAAQDFAKLESKAQRALQEKLAERNISVQEALAGDQLEFQKAVAEFEQEETQKVNALNAMNAMLNIGFTRAEVDDLLNQLGLDTLGIKIPGSTPAQQSKTTAPGYTPYTSSDPMARRPWET